MRRRRILKNIFSGKTSRTSPTGGKRGCLCKDSTYHADCCDGSLLAQGIGSTTQSLYPDQFATVMKKMEAIHSIIESK